MKKITLIVSIVMIGFVFNCSSMSRKEAIAKDYKTVGWLSDSIFQVVGKGQPYSNSKETGFLRQRAQAEEVGLADAKVQAYKLLLKDKYDKNNIPEDIKNIVESGRIFKKKWLDAKTCEITYRIEDKELKKLTTKQK